MRRAEATLAALLLSDSALVAEEPPITFFFAAMREVSDDGTEEEEEEELVLRTDLAGEDFVVAADVLDLAEEAAAAFAAASFLVGDAAAWK